jgi:hypothetical protein
MTSSRRSTFRFSDGFPSRLRGSQGVSNGCRPPHGGLNLVTIHAAPVDAYRTVCGEQVVGPLIEGGTFEADVPAKWRCPSCADTMGVADDQLP